MSRKLKLVMVDWIDTTTHGGWRDREEFVKEAKAMMCRTVGFQVGDDGECLKMAATLSSTDDCNDRSSIPKGCIIRKQVLDVLLPKLDREKKAHK